MKSCGSKVDIEGSGSGGGKASVTILEQQTRPGHTNGLAQLHRFQQPNGSAGPGLPLIIEKVGASIYTSIIMSCMDGNTTFGKVPTSAFS